MLINSWSLAKGEKMLEELSKTIALRIINSLKDGVPSVEDVEYFSSYHNPLDPIIESDMAEVSMGTYGKVKFLNGSYGEGKSHFLSRVRKKAKDDGFVVSMFAISPRGIALDMMERTFSEMMKTVIVKNYIKDGEETVIDYILSNWIRKVEDPEKELRKMALDKDLRAALTQFSKLIPQRTIYHREIDVLNGWLLADTHPIGDLKKKFGIYNHITARNVFDIIKSLGKCFKRLGYKGWIILIDEQEIISTLLTERKRELTDQNIRIFIDEQGNMDGIYIIFATTDEFFNDPKNGIVSYPALKTRITRANTMDLSPIGKKEMEEIASNLKEICQIAWNGFLRVTKDQLDECVRIALERNIPSARARTYVKSIIRLMETIKNGQTQHPAKTFAEIYNVTFNEVATEKEDALSET